MSLLVSKAGLEAKKKQLTDLQEELGKIQEFKGRIAIHSGDAWHDNNDFEQAEIDERRLLGRISEIHNEIASATIIDEEQNTNIVGFGSKVTVEIFCNGEEFVTDTYLFSDSDESTELTNISANSPIGSAIFKKEEGTTSSYTVNGNKFTVKILKIEY